MTTEARDALAVAFLNGVPAETWEGAYPFLHIDMTLIDAILANLPDGWVLARREDAEDGPQGEGRAVKVIDSRPCTYRDCGQQLVEDGNHRAEPHWHDDDAHSPTADCHTYTPKEESMPEKPRYATASIGTIVSVLREVDGDLSTAEVTVRMEGLPFDGQEFRLGSQALLGANFGELSRSIGPSPEEQAVIDAALQWVQAIPGSIAAQRIVTAVQALKEAK